MTCKWSAPFFEYYSHNIHSNTHAIVQWAIEPYGVYDPYSGATSNQAEGLNYVLKQLRNSMIAQLIAWSWPFTTYKPRTLLGGNQPW